MSWVDDCIQKINEKTMEYCNRTGKHVKIVYPTTVLNLFIWKIL